MRVAVALVLLVAVTLVAGKLRGFEDPERDGYKTRMSSDWINILVSGAWDDKDAAVGSGGSAHMGALFTESELGELGAGTFVEEQLNDDGTEIPLAEPVDEEALLAHANALDDAALEAAIHTLEQQDDVEVAWAEPREETEARMREISGQAKDAPLTSLQRFVLDYTNEQIRAGGKNTDLESNLLVLSRSPAPLAEEAEMRDMDRRALLSPLEKQVGDHVNHARLRGGSSVYLYPTYQRYLREYWRGAAAAEASAVYANIKEGDEELVAEVVCGKTQDEIRLLAAAYEQLKVAKEGLATPIESEQFSCELRAGRGVCAHEATWRSHLERDLFLEVGLGTGWREKFEDCLASRPVQDDAEYFFLSYAAREWQLLLRAADDQADDFIDSSVPMLMGIGWSAKALFGAARVVNEETKGAQEYFLELAKEHDAQGNTIMGVVAKTGFVLATVGGSLGTKALDHTLSREEIEQGLVDAALMVGSFGATSLVTVAAKTAAGVRALQLLSQATTRMSQLTYGVVHALGFAGKHYGKYNDLAAKVAALATRVGADTRRGKALVAYQKALRAAAQQAARADTAVSVARDTARAARAAIRKAGAASDEAAKAVEDATQAATMARREVIALREAQQSMRKARRASGAVRNAVGGLVDDARALVSKKKAPADDAAKVADDAAAGAADDAVRSVDDVVEVRPSDLPNTADGYGKPRAILPDESAEAMGKLRAYLDEVEAQTGIRYPEDAFEAVIRPINPYADAAAFGVRTKRLKESLVAFDDWEHILAFKLKKDIKVYRVGGLHDGAHGSGKWFTLKPTRSEKELREGLAVIDDFLKRPEVNWEGTLKEGSIIYFGKTAPQFGGAGPRVHMGGEMQIFGAPGVSKYVPKKAHFFGNVEQKHLAAEAVADAAKMAEVGASHTRQLRRTTMVGSVVAGSQGQEQEQER